MTSNERKIIKSLWEAKGKAHIQLIARETGFSQDYARILGRSLERAGYIKFADMNLCHLLTKGRARFQDHAPLLDSSPEVIVASVVAPATRIGDDVAEDSASKEAEDSSQASSTDTTDDSDLDKALAEVGISYPLKSGGEAVGIEPQVAAETEQKEPEVLQETEPAVAVSTESPQAAEKKTADNPASTAPLESSEKADPKEEPAKPSGGFGASFKKIVNWFAEKK